MEEPVDRFEVAVIGAGFGGLAVAHRLAQSGIDDLVIFERDDGVGGTWRANSYPGAACDVPSHLYSLSFAPNPYWSRVCAEQPEILAYIEDCYDRFDLRRKLRLSTEIVAIRWAHTEHRWHLRDNAGREYSAHVLVSAIGMFNTPATPAIPGIEHFSGNVFHSVRWDHQLDLAGGNVAVVGTGASAIQVVPAIAPRTARLDVYQRTSPWVLPRRDRLYTEQEQREFAAHPERLYQHRREMHDLFEQTTAFLADVPAAAQIATVARDYLGIKVADARLRDRLVPDTLFGCKRTLISSHYYPALQRDNVELITADIECVTAAGIRTVDGCERNVDAIVLCTGFFAAEYLRSTEVTGRDGTGLHAYWAGVPRAVEAMREREATSVEVTDDAMSRYLQNLRQNLQRTVGATRTRLCGDVRQRRTDHRERRAYRCAARQTGTRCAQVETASL
jgi:cyclohexanone monooxygenase